MVDISRATTGVNLPPEVSAEIWATAQEQSAVMQLARRITHPNVLRTFDFGEADGRSWISMEYVRGLTLRYLLGETRRVPYSAALRIARQLSAGLAAAHAVGVMHRDIKPENLILEANGNAKLMDFGIARPVRRDGQGHTEPGTFVGTPNYCAPEQLLGDELLQLGVLGIEHLELARVGDVHAAVLVR